MVGNLYHVGVGQVVGIEICCSAEDHLRMEGAPRDHKPGQPDQAGFARREIRQAFAMSGALARVVS